MTHAEIVNALLVLRPGAKWVLNADTYESLRWDDQEQEKPTSQEIESKIFELSQNQE